MALSTLNPSALEDLVTLTPRPAKKKIGPRLTRDIRRDILLLRELNDYEDEPEYTYERIADAQEDTQSIDRILCRIVSIV